MPEDVQHGFDVNADEELPGRLSQLKVDDPDKMNGIPTSRERRIHKVRSLRGLRKES